MRSNVIHYLIVPLIIILLTSPVIAIPPMPTEFYGSALVDGKPAPAGTVITAQINGLEKGSINTTVDGFYGGPGIFDDRLKVYVKEEEYRPGELQIVFLINGIQAVQIVDYEPGISKQLDLSTGAGAVGQAVMQQPAPMITQNSTTPPVPSTIQDSSGYIAPSSSGSSTISYGLDQPRIFKAEDGLAEVSFTKDTMLFSPEGQFLNAIGIRSKNIAELPPISTTQNFRFSGYAYEIIPQGTYFNPKGILTMRLPPERAYNIINTQPVIYEYLAQTASWEPVNTRSNTFTNEISGDIFEAGIYGLFTPVDASGQNQSTPDTLISPNATAVQSVISANQTNVSPVITPETIITPQTIITPLETIPPLPSNPPVSPIITDTPSPEPTLDQSPAAPLRLPGMGFITSLISSIKSRLSGPVLAMFGILAMIIAMNVLVYAVYRFWWQKRGKNG